MNNKAVLSNKLTLIVAILLFACAGAMFSLESLSQTAKSASVPPKEVSVRPVVLLDQTTSAWFQKPAAIKRYYVSPSGSGSGSLQAPLSLTRAIARAQPGDEYLLTAGTYVHPPVFNAGGTIGAPVVFRARPGDHAVIDGRLELDAGFIWIWGLEVTDPLDLGPRDSGISLLASGDRVINCVIHDVNGDVGNGIGAWDDGPGQVIYGNAIFHNGNGWLLGQPGPPHGIYTQNTFAAGGYKYFVENYLADPLQNCPPGCYNLHAYGSHGQTQGMFLARNVVQNGNVLLGGSGTPASNEVVLENFFYNASLRLGYHQVSQSTVQNNVLLHGSLTAPTLWGAGETRYPRTSFNHWTGNQIYATPHGGPQIDVRTGVNTGESYCENGCAPLDSRDVIDKNIYSAPFVGVLEAKGASSSSTLDLPEWRKQSTMAGNELDSNSAVVSLPTNAAAYVMPNVYDPSRALLVVFNWPHADQVTIQLHDPFPPSAVIRLLHPERPFDPPICSTAHGGSLTWNAKGAEFQAFLLVSSTGPQ